MIIIFIGPPFAGKDTQAKLLSTKIGLPVYSMGALIREAREKGDPLAIEGFEKYSMKGYHLPIELKFHLLKEKMDSLPNGLIIDNFPGNMEDLKTFNAYLLSKNLKVGKVFYLNINEEQMRERLIHRGRHDDNLQVVLERRRIQDKDRKAVIEYYKNLDQLIEIDGGKSVGEVHKQIMEEFKK